MRTIDGRTFWATAAAGVIATFVMTMTGFWQAGLGLPGVDVGAMLTGSMNAAHGDGDLYGPMAGNLAHFVNGIVLALIFVAFLQERLPGGWIVQGVIYAVLTTLAATLVVVPLAAGAGVFFSKTPMPGMMTLASTVIHLAYGLALTLSLKVAGVGVSRSGQTP